MKKKDRVFKAQIPIHVNQAELDQINWLASTYGTSRNALLVRLASDRVADLKARQVNTEYLETDSGLQGILEAIFQWHLSRDASHSPDTMRKELTSIVSGLINRPDRLSDTALLTECQRRWPNMSIHQPQEEIS